MRQAKPLLLEADWNHTVMMASSHSSLKYVCSPQLIDHWFNLWDVALYFWPRGTRLAQLLFRIVSQPVYEEKICPRHSDEISDDFTFADHLINSHGLSTIIWCQTLICFFVSPLLVILYNSITSIVYTALCNCNAFGSINVHSF